MGNEVALAKEILLDGFGRVNEGVADVIAGLSADDLLWRPEAEAKANSIGWLAWHLTRQQDVQLAQIAGVQQVWLSQTWYEKFALPYDKDAMGYGQTAADVGRFTITEPELLVDYQEATYAMTKQLLDRLGAADYERVIDENWDPPVTVAVRVYSVLEDCVKHLGQAEYLKGMLAAR